MTLYKIFKENEENLDYIHLLAKPVREHLKESQLKIIDGVIAMTKELELKVMEDLSEYEYTVNKSYKLALKDLKDKLLADRKLIEENK